MSETSSPAAIAKPAATAGFFRTAMMAAVMGAGLTAAFAPAAQAAVLSPFTFGPSALGGAAAGASNVTADNLLLSDYSTIKFTPTGANTSTFVEKGTLAVTGFELGSNAAAASGLNTTYGLYFSFTGTGDQTNFTPTLSSGNFNTLSFSLYGYTIPPSSASVSYFASDATPSGVVTPILLASGGLMTGTVTLTNGVPSASADLNFNVIDTPFFVAPLPFYNMALSAFTNTRNQISTASDGTITITQGGGVANFASVPEPASLALIGAGLLGLGLQRRRASRAG